MERLTKRVSNNRGHLARCHVCGNRCAEKCTECVDLGDALYKLAEYEDTGLTPEEVGEYVSIVDIFNEREYRKKFLDEWRAEYEGEHIGAFAGFPDADLIFKRYFVLKRAIELVANDLSYTNQRLDHIYDLARCYGLPEMDLMKKGDCIVGYIKRAECEIETGSPPIRPSCDFCVGHEISAFNDDDGYNTISAEYCPKCGRKLEEDETHE